MRKVLVIFTIALTLCGASLAHAAIGPIDLSKYGVKEFSDIGISPDHPKPGESATVTLESTTADLSRSQITWSLNGVVAQNSIGQATFTFKAGKLGAKSEITAHAITPSGTTIDQSITVIPADIDLIWQADTYVPPFYEGKAMYTLQSALHIVAVPHFLVNGQEVNPNTIVYKWTADGSVEGDQSGYGKNVLDIAPNGDPGGTYVDVVASTYDNSQSAEETVTINSSNPKAISYENHPRYGILGNNALVGDAAMTAAEITLTAYPYFFSTGSASGGLHYNWTSNGDPVTDVTGGTIVFRNESNLTGHSLVGLNITEPQNILQYADSELNLQFTSTKDSKSSL